MNLQPIAAALPLCLLFAWGLQSQDAGSKNSLAHFQAGEAFFAQHNYQFAGLEFKAALVGDLQPKWTEVWSHLELGKVWDITRQRSRAIHEYELAQATKDNTRGALDEAAKYLKVPFEGS